MPFNPNGSNPIANIKFGGTESGTCTFFIRKTPSQSWTQIATVKNRPFASHNIVVDPTIFLGAGSSVKDIKGAQLSFTALFLDVDGDNVINYSLDIELTQDGNGIIKKNYNGNETTAPFVAFSEVFTIN